MTTDTSEKGLERLICTALTGAACDPLQDGAVRERPSSYGAGWICGDTQDYDREYCVDLAQLSAFLQDTQPDAAESLGLDEEAFDAHYHRRSNAETTFSMVKGKFGDSVRAKSYRGQVNEVLLKCLCHNICVLIHAMHELGTPRFNFGRN